MDEIDEFFSKLTLKDEGELFVGKNFWETNELFGKSLWLSDGPHGIRKVISSATEQKSLPSICYPSACLSACSFDKDLLNELGKNLASEAIHQGVDVLLGPGVNIKRNPLCGRNFEYFSEDPLLAGKLASSYINGVQSKNVGVSIKHYALNNQEKARFVSDSICDERTMREIYLKAFEIAIKESSPWTIMASYNKINGVHATENEFLLHDILRDEFKFDGIVMTDWGAINDPVSSLKAGLDLEMPGTCKGAEKIFETLIENNLLDENILHESTKRKEKLYKRCMNTKIDDFSLEKSLVFAEKLANESIVLLKNEDHILPLKREQKIALIGDFSKNPRYQGGGSSTINALNVTSIYDEFIINHINFEYAKGYKQKSLRPNKKLIKEAIKIAKRNDVVLLSCGLPEMIESEGYDRNNLKMPSSQLKLIDEIYKVNPNLILILENGSPIEMPFINNIKGLIEGYFGGSLGGRALFNVVFGRVNPSGRLAETFPLSYDDVINKNEYLRNPYVSLYNEAIYVGYRYYDTFNKPVLFPFGYGLSYSDIIYSSLEIEEQNDTFIVKIKVKNNSNIACKEVVQLYVGELNPKIFKAKKELKDFTKISLNANEEKTVELKVKKDELRYYSIKQQKWILEEGIYRFYVSKNVSDETNFVDLKIESNDESEDLKDLYPYYYNMDHEVTKDEFEKYLGRTINEKRKIRPFTLESTVNDLSYTLLGFILIGLTKILLPVLIKNPMLKKIIQNLLPYQPLRSLGMSGALTKQQVEGIVDLFNWHFIKGFRKLFSKKIIIDKQKLTN